MASPKDWFNKFMNDETGLSVVEYVVGGAILVLALAATDPWSGLSGAVENVVSQASEAE
ncbi:hypothetical protein [Vibrio hangzhouensis]|uniref:hypothetical protein n=1 Tax=Vibrio hangzhouensis TaxID=462991 RepID=UPI001C95F052|nr:hypothetical protein [Vibrio hangzhouensis]MBY6196591.1 hypothetical protein [Vibrio hangzhouensis]